MHQGCRFYPWSRHIRESTDECINKWNNKSMFLFLSLPPPPPVLHPLSLNINKIKNDFVLKIIAIRSFTLKTVNITASLPKVLQRERHKGHLRGQRNPQVSDSAGLVCSLKICISNKFPGLHRENRWPNFNCTEFRSNQRLLLTVLNEVGVSFRRVLFAEVDQGVPSVRPPASCDGDVTQLRIVV